MFRVLLSGGALAASFGRALIPDLGVMGSSPILGVEITKKINFKTMPDTHKCWFCCYHHYLNDAQHVKLSHGL